MMKSSFVLIAAVVFLFFVYVQGKNATAMPTSEEVPIALTKEEVGQISDEEWRERLTSEQYSILRKSGTERPNGQVYKQFKAQEGGTYFCVGCNTELFSSKEKIKAECGWPAFYDPSKSENVRSIFETDGTGRIEVRCATCDGHLGHVFTGEGYDTPTDQRYCINGSVLRFVPAEAVEAAKKAMAEESASKEKG